MGKHGYHVIDADGHVAESGTRVLPYVDQPFRDRLERLIEWRKQNNLPPRVSATFNILYDNPAETPPEDYRLDICAATNRAVADNPFGIVEKTIPAGRCAVLRHVGSEDTLGEAIENGEA